MMGSVLGLPCSRLLRMEFTQSPAMLPAKGIYYGLENGQCVPFSPVKVISKTRRLYNPVHASTGLVVEIYSTHG